MAYRVKIGARLDKDIRRLLGAQTGRAIGYLSGVLDEGGSSIHATRKALKRCRSILRLVRPSLSGKTFRAHDRAFRDIARHLSHDRDREVIADTLSLLAAKNTGDAKAALTAALEEINTINLNGFGHQASEENIARAIAMLQERDHAILSLDIKKVRLEALAEGFSQTYAEGRKALKAAYRINDDEAFHTFRKALQHHWRHCQLLVPAWPDMINVRITAARDLSQIIGIDHDLSLVGTRFATPDHSALPAEIRTRICAAAKAEQMQLRADAKPLARRLYAQSPESMERLILDLWPAAIRVAKHQRKPETADLSLDDAIPLNPANQH